MNFQTIARALDPKLYDSIQRYRITDEALIPVEYRYPDGRWRHDDWFILKNTTRKECYYRVPLPFKVIEGPHTKAWMLFDPSYPMSPDVETKTENGLLYVLTDRGSHGLVKYAAFINGEWKHVFTKYTGIWFGKRLSWYKGLHQDNHVTPPSDNNGVMRSDLGCWFPELACSWKKEI